MHAEKKLNKTHFKGFLIKICVRFFATLKLILMFSIKRIKTRQEKHRFCIGLFEGRRGEEKGKMETQRRKEGH